MYNEDEIEYWMTEEQIATAASQATMASMVNHDRLDASIMDTMTLWATVMTPAQRVRSNNW